MLLAAAMAFAGSDVAETPASVSAEGAQRESIPVEDDVELCCCCC